MMPLKSWRRVHKNCEYCSFLPADLMTQDASDYHFCQHDNEGGPYNYFLGISGD